MSSHEQNWCEFHAVTPGDRHHYFGYYDKFPWNATERYLLALEPEFIDRQPTPDDVLSIGMVDLERDGAWTPLAWTRAWNWQQGIMLQWLPTEPDRKIIYNDRRSDTFVSIIRDVCTGEEQTLPRPIYALRPDGKQAVSVNFARIARTRPGYGYEGVRDPGLGNPHPDDDGIWVMDLETGEHERTITLAQAAALRPLPSMENATEHWFNHLQYNADGSRFLFLHRWGLGDGIRWGTRMLTASPDGSDVRIIADDGMTSHFDWRDADYILAWATQHHHGGDHYYLFDAMSGDSRPVGTDVLECDGHCSFSPDRRWILTDTYPDGTHHRTLILFDPAKERRIDIGRFYSPPEVTGPFRCDLHPRWSRDGTQVCIDSVHEGMRQMYVGDVGHIVE